MNDMLVAQCPHCQTRFRLSEDHLQAAAGNVRCGACLKVFNASAQAEATTTDGSPVAVDQRQSGAAEEPAISRQGTLLIHDDLELDDLDLEALGLDESILEEINPDARTVHADLDEVPTEPPADTTPLPAVATDPAAELTEPEEPTGTGTRKDAFFALRDEDEIQRPDHQPADAPAWRSDLPLDETAVEPAIDQPAAASQHSDWAPTDAEIDRAFEFDAASETPDPWDLEFNLDSDLGDRQADTDKSTDGMDDTELHEAFRNAASSRDFAPRLTPTETPADEHKSTLFGMDIPVPIRPLTAEPPEQGMLLRDRPFILPAAEPPVEQQPVREKAPVRQAKPSNQERQEPRLDFTGFDDDDLHLPDLVDEPLYLDERPRARRPKRQWLWTLLSVIAALALLGQIAIYNYAALAHSERARPVMEQLCFLVGCELPARVNIDLIRSSNLVVRPHPDFPKALAIDVILYNRADFAQPFPVLRMTFTDLAGRELSSKLFQPTEYLGGELAGTTLMPPQTPVHVGLSMLDPGSNVASYTLDFVSP